MSVKVFDSELRLMEALWDKKKSTAKELAVIMKEKTGWSKTTTYTVIKKCVEKGIIFREEPDFVCIPAISKEEVQEYETNELIDKVYGGDAGILACALVNSNRLSSEEMVRLKKLIDSIDK